MWTVRVKVSNWDDIARELRRQFPDRPLEGIVVIGYGCDGRTCGMAVNRQHRALSWLKVWELVSLADDLAACSVAVMVFPAGPATTPTAHEVAVFGDLAIRARRAGLPLLDCLVARGERLWSLRELHDGRISA